MPCGIFTITRIEHHRSIFERVKVGWLGVADMFHLIACGTDELSFADRREKGGDVK